ELRAAQHQEHRLANGMVGIPPPQVLDRLLDPTRHVYWLVRREVEAPLVPFARARTPRRPPELHAAPTLPPLRREQLSLHVDLAWPHARNLASRIRFANIISPTNCKKMY